MDMLVKKFTQAKNVNSQFLAPCSKKKNCVSSLAAYSSDKYIDAFVFSKNPQSDFQALQLVLSSMPGIGVITVQQNYIHAKFKSRWFGFVDDLEFYWDENDELCHVRSASRLGYYDFGVNRKRVERIRTEFVQHKKTADD